MTYDDPETALRDAFGYEAFREGQRDVIETVLEGRDLLAIMPTGSGKSLCYQLPSTMLPGTTLVVSPLIALMQDQIESLREHGVPAARIDSSLSRAERRRRMAGLEEGEFDLLYVAPERFQNEAFREVAGKADISLLAIDEAHCVSHWGHDFRPDYLALEEAREWLGEPTVLALTATATRQVRRDILEELGLDDADVIVGGFERPNLRFDVHRAAGDEQKLERLREVLQPLTAASSVVYCATRKTVEETKKRLEQAGFVAGAYHGGMGSRRREATQDAFMAGDLPVLVATKAFGMGVDKPDIRAIVHYDIPGSLEAYYQQSGRAGRDGEPAHCLMLFDPSDRDVHEFFIENSYPERGVVEAVWRELARRGTGEHEVSPEQLAEQVTAAESPHPWAVETSLEHLEKGGHVACEWRGRRHVVEVLDRSRIRDLRVDWKTLDEQREINQQHLEDVVKYATGRSCRQAYMLHYFGTTPSFGDQCGNCDVCLDAEIRLDLADASSFPDEPAETILRKVLSAVARTKGGATRREVAAVLRGSSAERLEESGYTELSTFGLLEGASQHDLVGLLRDAEEADLVAADEDGRLRLTRPGVEVMKDDESVPATLERRIREIAA